MFSLPSQVVWFPVFVGLKGLYALDPIAKCNIPNTTWTFNQHSVSPCLVANALDQVCYPFDDYPGDLDKAEQYSGPDLDESTPCDCSSVLYSMLSACAVCQGATVQPWADYIGECRPEFISIGSFPLGIPSDTSVPAWAFIDPSDDNIWNAQKAKELADKHPPDLTANPTSSISVASSSSTSNATVTSKQTQASNTSPPDARNKPKHTGAIVGGVVGGVVGIFLVAACGWLFYRRHRYLLTSGSRQISEQAKEFPETSLKLYNPDDPSTWPPPNASPSSPKSPDATLGAVQSVNSFH